MKLLTPVNGAQAAADLPWYVVYSKPHREGLAETHIRQRGFEVFYPRLELPLYAAEHRPLVPLFPSYLFVRLDLSRWHDVAWAPGVKYLVHAGGVPTPLDAEVVAFLKRNATADGRLRGRPDLQRGQEVEVRNGPFAGLIAIIEDPPDARGRIRVLMRLLSSAPVRVRLPLRFVRSGWVA